MTAGTTQSEYLNLTLNELFQKIDSLTKDCDGAKTRISELEAKLKETEQILNQQTLAAAAKEKEKETEQVVKTSEIPTKSKAKTAMKTQTQTKTKAAMKTPAVSKRKKSNMTAAAASNGSRSSRRSRLKISSKITGSGFHCANCDTVLPFEGTKKTIVKNVGEDAYNRFPAQKCPKCGGISQYVTSTGGVLLVPGK